MSLPWLFAQPFVTTLAEPVTAEATEIKVAEPAPAALQLAGQFSVLLGAEEYITVTGGAASNGKTWQVLRGQEGSTGVPHATGETVLHLLTAAAIGGQTDAEAAKPSLRSLGTGAQQAAPGTTTATAEAAAAAATAASSGVETERKRAEKAEGEKLAKTANLSDLASASEARSHLGLGSAATQNTTAFDAAGAATVAQAAAEAASVPLSQKGAAGGVTPLESASSRIGSVYIPGETFYIDSGAAEYQGVDIAKTIMEKATEGWKRFFTWGGHPLLLNSGCFFDATQHEGIWYHLESDGHTPYLLGKELPVVTNFLEPEVKWAFFVNQKRESLENGKVTLSTATNAAGGLSSRMVVHDGVMFTAEEPNTGVFYTNKCGVSSGIARVQNMKYYQAAFGYGEGNRFIGLQAPLVEGGILFYQPEGGDSNYFQGLEVNTKCVFWYAVGARGGEAVGCVNGGFHFSQCRAIDLTACHSEGYSNDPWLWVDRSQLKVNGGALSPENAGKEVSRGIIVEDSSSEERRSTLLIIENTTHYTNLAVEPEKTAISNIEIRAANPGTRIIARNVTKGTKVSGLFEYNPTVPQVTSTVPAIQEALSANPDLIGGGNWELGRNSQNTWNVNAPSPLAAIRTPRVLSAPTVGAGPGAAATVIGTLEAGAKYEYVAACRDVDGNYSPLSATFVREVASTGTTHSLYTLPATPCDLRLWRKKNEGGVKTEPTAYVDIPLPCAQSLIYDTGAYCNQQKWVTENVPIPETVAASNTTWERIRFSPGTAVGWIEGEPENATPATPGSLALSKNRGRAYVKESGTGTSGWYELLGRKESVTQEKIALEAVGEKQIKAKAISSSRIAANAVETEHLKSEAVTAGKIAKETITAEQLAGEAVGTNQLAKEAVIRGKIAKEAINAEKLASEAVGTNQIAKEAVTEGKLAAKAVGAGKLNTSAVETENIKAEAVTGGKIAKETITGEKLAGEAVGTSQIAKEAVIEGKLAKSLQERFLVKARGSIGKPEEVPTTTPVKGEYGYTKAQAEQLITTVNSLRSALHEQGITT